MLCFSAHFPGLLCASCAPSVRFLCPLFFTLPAPAPRVASFICSDTDTHTHTHTRAHTHTHAHTHTQPLRSRKEPGIFSCQLVCSLMIRLLFLFYPTCVATYPHTTAHTHTHT